MNRVILMGRLCKDPEIRYGQNQTCVASMSIAVNRKFKREGEPEADFFNCTSFGKQAEFAEKYLKKGVKVILEGRIQNESYEKDGDKKQITKIYVDGIEFAESKAASESNGGGNSNPAPSNGFIPVPSGLDDELPFA